MFGEAPGTGELSKVRSGAPGLFAYGHEDVVL
jgi:hypothetical protein